MNRGAGGGASAAAAALVAGAALGVVALTGGTMLLYTGEGFLTAVAFLLALGVAATGAGVWYALREGAGRGTRVRWTGAVVAFAAAAIFAELWAILPAFRTTLAGNLLGVVFLIAEPAFAVGAVLAALQAHASALPPGGRGWRLPPAGMGPLGVGIGLMTAALVVIPGVRLGTGMLAAGVAVALAGIVEARSGARERRSGMTVRVALVTGVGGRGQVGYAVAEAFLRRGDRVVVTGVREDVDARARELASHGEVHAVRADLTRPDDVDRLLDEARDRFGRLDYVVNVAGGLSVIRPVAETTPEEWEREIRRNATTAFLVTRAALPLLRASRGAVVNFTSPAALRTPGTLAAYGAAKAAVVALTRSAALEEQPHGVRLNAIAPGMIDTDQNRASADDPDRVGWVTREQVVDVALFLASDLSSGINGAVIPVPGAGLEA